MRWSITQGLALAVGLLTAVASGAADIKSDIPKPVDLYIPAPVDPGKYQIGAEDVLYVHVWREPDFTLAVTVRPDGKITLPLIGDVQASGDSPVQLTASLKKLLGNYLNNPDVNVSVMEVRSKKFYIDGEMNRPGSFPLVTPTSMLEALSRGAGFHEFANTKRIRLLRGSQVLYFNYNQVTKGKHLEQNVAIENGDHIIVP